MIDGEFYFEDLLQVHAGEIGIKSTELLVYTSMQSSSYGINFVRQLEDSSRDDEIQLKFTSLFDVELGTTSHGVLLSLALGLK